MITRKIIEEELKRLPNMVNDRIKTYKRTKDTSYLHQAIELATQIQVYEFVLNAKAEDWETK